MLISNEADEPNTELDEVPVRLQETGFTFVRVVLMSGMLAVVGLGPFVTSAWTSAPPGFASAGRVRRPPAPPTCSRFAEAQAQVVVKRVEPLKGNMSYCSTFACPDGYRRSVVNCPPSPPCLG